MTVAYLNALQSFGFCKTLVTMVSAVILVQEIIPVLIVIQFYSCNFSSNSNFIFISFPPLILNFLFMILFISI